MGSLLRRSLIVAVNNFLRNKQLLAIKRCQQTNAALNSINENQQVKKQVF